MRFLFLAFVLVPIIEMWLLITVGRHIGALVTIGLVLLTAVVGFALLRQQGFETLLRGRSRLDSGELPTTEMLEGLVLAVSGALLMTPGFLTDMLGFVGLMPALRRGLIGYLAPRMDVVQLNRFEVNQKTRDQHQEGDTLEGEFWREDK